MGRRRKTSSGPHARRDRISHSPLMYTYKPACCPGSSPALLVLFLLPRGATQGQAQAVLKEGPSWLAVLVFGILDVQIWNLKLRYDFLLSLPNFAKLCRSLPAFFAILACWAPSVAGSEGTEPRNKPSNSLRTQTSGLPECNHLDLLLRRHGC